VLCAIFIDGWRREVGSRSQDSSLPSNVGWQVLWYGVSQNEFVFAWEKASLDGRAEGATSTPEAG